MKDTQVLPPVGAYVQLVGHPNETWNIVGQVIEHRMSFKPPCFMVKPLIPRPDAEDLLLYKLDLPDEHYTYHPFNWVFGYVILTEEEAKQRVLAHELQQ